MRHTCVHFIYTRRGFGVDRSIVWCLCRLHKYIPLLFLLSNLLFFAVLAIYHSSFLASCRRPDRRTLQLWIASHHNRYARTGCNLLRLGQADSTVKTMELISRIGQKKSKMRLDKLWWNSVLAGPLLGFGCAITLSTNAAPWYQDNAPGLIRTVAASFFPIGLILVVLTGADLYTSNVMFLPVAYLHRRASLLDIAKSWGISFFGNLAGMLFFCKCNQALELLSHKAQRAGLGFVLYLASGSFI